MRAKNHTLINFIPKIVHNLLPAHKHRLSKRARLYRFLRCWTALLLDNVRAIAMISTHFVTRLLRHPGDEVSILVFFKTRQMISEFKPNYSVTSNSELISVLNPAVNQNSV